MRTIILSLALLLLLKTALAQTAHTDPDCVNATTITQTDNFCSAPGQYSTSSAKPTSWFKFTATHYDVVLTVTGQTLNQPVVGLYTDCEGNEVVGTSATTNNVTSFYKGGLIVGHTYYVLVKGDNAPGSFKLCMNTYNPIPKPGQDCETASLLCSTQTISQLNVAGAGNNNHEAAGTCLDVGGLASEQNSVWYKWKAANNGTLVFTITPTINTDDLDFVLYDLDLSGDCANVNAAHVIRCAAGNGISNKNYCPTESVYYKTGLDFASTDLSEQTGCGQGQDGKVRFITMQEGHYYALLINNFISSNNGFTLEFKDQNGVAGTGLFTGPHAEIAYSSVQNCTANQYFTFSSDSKDYTSLQWNFGEGASITNAKSAGPFTVAYTTPGVKTITLEAATPQGCVDLASQTITVASSPPLPTIQVNKPAFCVSDTIILSVAEQPSLTYHWTGPNNFIAEGAKVYIAVKGKSQSGAYQLHVARSGCISEAATVIIPEILDYPEAAFDAQPSIPAKLTIPADIQFYNRSSHADHFLWDFGDGQASTEPNPMHHYILKGTYKIKLTAFQQAACSTSVLLGDFVLLDGTGLYVPNAFTPNGDGINDEFVINLTNLASYQIEIFNRYGQKLFQSSDTFDNWDGNYKGQPVPAGVYYYLINATEANGKTIRQSGYVTLLR